MIKSKGIKEQEEVTVQLDEKLFSHHDVVKAIRYFVYSLRVSVGLNYHHIICCKSAPGPNLVSIEVKENRKGD